ncbi:MAG: serine/threonine-protein kinase [Anaerolineales bacterium]
MENLIGQSIGRYHVLEQLGEGGMATVFKAYDTRLEREVAFKVIRKDAFPPEQLERILKRFEREAKALARLTHPNIVSIIDYGDHEGAPYLVMPFLPGGTLKQSLGKPLPWREAVQLILPVAHALAFAHSQGIVHRDVKPANILTTLSGEPMLTDFGIAKILEDAEGQTLTGTGVGIGTPEYMAPEQWTGQAGPQADVYSLGVVFYELVTGRKPYTADTPAAVLLKQSSEPLPRPRQFARDLPEAVEQVLFKALAKSPQARYPSMDLFVKALEGLLAGTFLAADEATRDDFTPDEATLPKTAHPPTTPPARQRPASKRRRLFILLAVVLGPILLCILACLAMWGFGICPPQGPWPQPPWCPGSPYIWPFNEPLPLETPTRAGAPAPEAMEAPAMIEMARSRGVVWSLYSNQEPVDRNRSHFCSVSHSFNNTSISCCRRA